MKRLLFLCAGLAAVLYVGCKQGDGDRCQVNDDCESGVCNQAKGTCSGANGDQSEIDGSVPDALIDAAPDAPPDAPPTM